jgi:hypothetical protein
VDIIKIDIGEIEWGVVDFNGQVQDGNRWRGLVKAVMKLRVP